jgi:hypothetical protein
MTMFGLNKDVVILISICFIIGCGGKTTPIQPLRVQNLPAPPPGCNALKVSPTNESPTSGTPISRRGHGRWRGSGSSSQRASRAKF